MLVGIDTPSVDTFRTEDLQDGESYVLSVKAQLDIESLPLPLRPMAYITPSWNLASERKQWHLKP